jgi:glycosyltransferase involved in cell wall biosynthesis
MRILFLCHGHPALQAGGTEIAAHALFRALRARPGIDGAFIAGASALHRPQSPGTAIQAIGDAPDELLLWTAGFDRFALSQTDLHGVAPALTELLETLRPDVVHLHHLLLLGAESLQLIRRVRPQAKLILTLHDYYAICAHEGTMLTSDGRLCGGASADACARCLPDRGPTDFRLREVALRHLLGLCDHFIAPSRFLRQRYVEWGLDARRITVLGNGLPEEPAAPHREADGERRDRFAFFGHINRFKGATLLLQAGARLARDGVAHRIDLHGGTAYQTPEFLAGFARLLEEAPGAVHHGAYAREALPRLMAQADWVVVPSLWWENAPLVIQEAQRHRRPVIAADIGGMAEMVTHGTDGLLFRAGDARALADAMARAAADPAVWAALVQNIRQPLTADEAAGEHLALYESLGARAAARGRSRTMPRRRSPPARKRAA